MSTPSKKKGKRQRSQAWGTEVWVLAIQMRRRSLVKRASNKRYKPRSKQRRSRNLHRWLAGSSKGRT